MPVNTGHTANDGSGDPLRTAFITLNNEISAMLAELSDVRLGRVWHAINRNVAALTPPNGTTQISIAHDAGHDTWRLLSGQPAVVNPAIHVQSTDGRW